MRIKAEHRPLLLSILFAIVLVLSNITANAQQGLRVPNLDEYCKLKPLTARETIIYLDGSSIRSEHPAELATVITQKLGLAPRERVRIFYVKSSDHAKDIFNKCWPELTPEELSNRASSGWFDYLKTWLDENPETKLKDTKDFFRLNVQNSIQNELAGNPPKDVDLVQLLSADRNRLASGGRLYRILVFSSMNSTAMRERATGLSGEAKEEADRVENLIREFPLTLHGAETIVWGVAADEKLPLRTAERYWTAYFQRGHSNLQSYAPDLPIQRVVTVSTPASFSGTWRTAQASGRASLVIASTQDGYLTSSWVTIRSSKSFSIPLHGTYECKGPKECLIKATVAKDTPYLLSKPFFQEGDLVEVGGDPASKMTGSIKPPSPTAFPGGAQVLYSLELQRD